jgi:hypothetical protein
LFAPDADSTLIETIASNIGTGSYKPIAGVVATED